MITAIALVSILRHSPTLSSDFVADSLSVTPGSSFTVGLNVKLEDGWHMYYANPGESGLATKMIVTAPAGWKVSPMNWEFPHRLFQDNTTTLVYEEGGRFTVNVSVPKDFKPGTYTLPVSASWLACLHDCTPQKASSSLSIVVGAAATPNPAFAKIASERKAVTGQFSGKAEAKVEGKNVVVTLNDPNLDVKDFVAEDGDSFGPKKFKIQKTATGVTMWLELIVDKAPKKVSGLVLGKAKGEEKEKAYRVEVPVTGA